MRYLPLTPEDRAEMLARIGVRHIDDLFADVPAAALRAPDLPPGGSEQEVERTLAQMAARNTTAGSVPFFVGCGAYRHYLPASVDHLIQRSEFLTSYTPYQPEIAQGTLQALFEFQTQVAMLTGMEVANASMYDGSTAAGALLVAVVTEIVSLGLLIPPGECGADIVVAEGQSLGNPLSFGGPYVGLFATRQKFVRQMPGRLAGATIDADGRRGFVLTLSAREQHIRREKATSNICTSAGLCALAFSIHLTLLGEAGLKRLAHLNHAHAIDLADKLAAIPGVSVLNGNFFNEFTIRVPGNAAEVVEALARRGVLGGVPVSRLEPQRPELKELICVAATG